MERGGQWTEGLLDAPHICVPPQARRDHGMYEDFDFL